MTAKCTAQLLANLGVTRSLSRPQVSDDNPFSEAQFKTLKYAPAFPDRFGGYEHARSYCRDFFPWYNGEHRHSGIAMLTPLTVHEGRADEVLTRRQAAPDAAFGGHPDPVPPAAPQVRPPPPAARGRTEVARGDRLGNCYAPGPGRAQKAWFLLGESARGTLPRARCGLRTEEARGRLHAHAAASAQR